MSEIRPICPFVVDLTFMEATFYFSVCVSLRATSGNRQNAKPGEVGVEKFWFLKMILTFKYPDGNSTYDAITLHYMRFLKHHFMKVMALHW